MDARSWCCSSAAGIRAGDEEEEPRLQPRALVVGQRSRALLVSPAAEFRTVAVRLRPSALGRVLHDDASQLTDGWAIARGGLRPGRRAAWPPRSRTRHGRRAPGDPRALRACVASRAPAPERLERTLGQAVRRARGRITVRALRQATGASERWLERAFLREVGLSPRTPGRGASGAGGLAAPRRRAELGEPRGRSSRTSTSRTSAGSSGGTPVCPRRRCSRRSDRSPGRSSTRAGCVSLLGVGTVQDRAAGRRDRMSQLSSPEANR